ncbi:MAG: PaaI family thioesterase [Thermodesulfobacteriota bacterium]
MNADRIEFLKSDYVNGFPGYCGFTVDRVAEGLFETRLDVRPEHSQQDGFVHAGVIATMADHTAGYAAFTTVPENVRILTVEFKINYLKPARGKIILCRSTVISGGKKIIVSESEVFSWESREEKLVSKAMVTLMAVPKSELKRP